INHSLTIRRSSIIPNDNECCRGNTMIGDVGEIQVCEHKDLCRLFTFVNQPLMQASDICTTTSLNLILKHLFSVILCKYFVTHYPCIPLNNINSDFLELTCSTIYFTH